MSISLGQLILTLGVDSTDYSKQLQQARAAAIAASKDIEQRFEKAAVSIEAQVDDSQLTDLNKHLDLKEAHAKKIQKFFNQNPLKPKTDTTDLEKIPEQFDLIQRELQKLNRHLKTSPLAIETDTVQVQSAVGRVNDLETKVKGTRRDFSRNPVKVWVDTSEVTQAQKQVATFDESLTRMKRRSKSDVFVTGAHGNSYTFDRPGNRSQSSRSIFDSPTSSSRTSRTITEQAIDLAISEGITQSLKGLNSTLKGAIDVGLAPLKPLGVTRLAKIEVNKQTNRLQKTYNPEGSISTRAAGVARAAAMAPIRMISRPITQTIDGFYQGIGDAYGGAFAQGSMKEYERRSGKTIESIGEKVAGSGFGRFTPTGAMNEVLNRADSFATVRESVSSVAAKYGVNAKPQTEAESIGGKFASRTAGVAEILNKAIKSEDVEHDVNSAKDAFDRLSKSIFKANSQAERAIALKDLANSLGDIGAYPKEAVIAQYKATARESATNLESRLHSPLTPIQPLDPGTKRVAFVSGGFAGEGGQRGHAMAEMLKPHIAEGTHVVPFENREFDVSTSAKEGMVGLLGSAFDQMSGVLQKGHNPAAVRMAAEAKNYKEANPGVGIDLIGHSAGGLIAREAQEILKKLDIESNVLSLGTPTFGAFKGTTSNALGLIGKGDILKNLTDHTSTGLSGVTGHEIPLYVKDPKFQGAVKKFTEEGVSSGLRSDLREPESETEMQANFRKATAKAADMAFALLGQPIPSETKQKVQEGYKKAAIEIKQMVDEGRSSFAAGSAKAGFRATEVTGAIVNPRSKTGELLPRVASNLSAEEAEQVSMFVGGFGGVKGMESEYMGSEVARSLPKHHVVAVESPEFDLKPDPNDSATSPKFLHKAYQTVTKQAAEDGENVVAKRVAERAYQYHVDNPGKPINIIGQSGGAMSARAAADILKEMGVPDVRVASSAGPYFGASSQKGMTLLSKNDPFSSIPGSMMPNKISVDSVMGHSRYFDNSAEATSALERAHRAEQGATVEPANPNPQVQQALHAFFDRSHDETTALEMAREAASAAGQRQKVRVSRETPPVEPSAPAIDREALQQEYKSNFVRKDLEHLARSAGVANPAKFDKAGLASQIVGKDPVAAERLLAEQKLVSQYARMEQLITKNLDIAKKAGGGVASDTAIGKIREQAVSQASQMDATAEQITNPFLRRRLGALRGRYQSRLNTSLAITPTQAEEAKQKLEQEQGSGGSSIDEGLPRVTMRGMMQGVSGAFEGISAGKEKMLRSFKSLGIWRQATENNLSRNYEEIAKQVASVSGVHLDLKNLPELKVDPKRLAKMGADAYYDFKNNQIFINKELGEILNKNPQELVKYSNKIKGLVHELRHGAQLDFGKTPLSEVASGSKVFATPVEGFENANPINRFRAKRSLEALQREALKTNGYKFNPNEQNAIKNAEADAYTFENQTKKVVSEAAKNLSGQAPTMQQNVKGKAKQIVNDFLTEFEFLSPGLVGFFRKAFDSAGTVLLSFRKLFNNTVTGFISLKILSAIAPDATKAAASLQQLQAQFNYVFGGAAEGAKKLEYARSTLKGLSADLQGGSNRYIGLATAAKGTRLEGAATDKIFKSLEGAYRATNASPEQSNLATLAVQQMVQKSTVSSEELRQQLSEALPIGVFQIASAAIGVTTEQLDKMLKTGQILAEDFLPKFASQLSAKTSLGIPGAMNTAAAATNRFQSSMLELQEQFGKPFAAVEQFKTDALTAGLEAVKPAAGIAANALIFAFVGSIAQVSIAIVSLISEFKLWGIAGKLALMALKPLGGFLLGFAGQFAAVQLAIDLVTVAFQAWTNAGGAVTDFANQSATAFDNYLQTIGAVIDKTKELADYQGKLKAPVYGENTAIGGIVQAVGNTAGGEGAGTQYMRRSAVFQGAGDYQAIANIKAMLGITPSQEEVNKAINNPTVQPLSVKRGDDVIQSTDRSLLTFGALSSQARVSLMGADMGKGDLAQTIKIDQGLRNVQAKIGSLEPGDLKGRRVLDDQRATLLAAREASSKSVAQIQEQLSADIEGFKAAKEQIKQTLDEGGLRPDQEKDLKQQYDQVNSALKTAQMQSDQFNQAISKNVTAAELLARAFQQVGDEAAKANADAQMAYAQDKLGVAEKGATTASPVETQEAKSLVEQKNLSRRIEINQQEVKKLNALLHDSQLTQAIAMSGGGSLDSLGAAGLATRADQQKENPDLSGKLKEASENYARLQQVQTESVDLQSQAADSVTQAREALRSTNRSITDYFKSVGDSVADLGATVKSTQFDTEIQNQKNKIQKRLSGLGNTFFSDLGDILSGLLDDFFAPLKNGLDTDNTIRSELNRLRDQQQQGMDLLYQNQSGGRGTGVGAALAGSAANFTPYVVQTPSGATAHSQGELEAHHDYQSKDGREVRDLTLVDPKTNRDDVPIPSPVSGKVDYVGNDPNGYGNFVDLKDDQGRISRLAHLLSTDLKEGQQISEGQSIGIQGRSGDATGVHIHLEAPSDVIKRYIPALNAGSFPGGSQPQQQQRPQQTSSAPGAVDVSQEQAMRLALLSRLEATTPQGQLDVAQSVFNRLNSGSYGGSLDQVMFAQGQYEPFFGTSASQLQNKDQIVEYARSKGISESELMDTIGRMSNPQLMSDSARFVGGRTDFKGVSEYGNRVASEDPLRQSGENYFHISGSQTYEQLAELARRSPTAINVSGVASKGSNGVDAAGITAVDNQSANASAAFIQAQQAKLAAINEDTANKVQQGLNRFVRTLQTGGEKVDDSVLVERRRQEDQAAANLPDTPNNRYQTSLRGIDRQEEDANKTNTRGLRDLTDSLRDLQGYRDSVVDVGKIDPRALTVLPELDKQIINLTLRSDELKAAIANTAQGFAGARKKLEEDHAREMASAQLDLNIQQGNQQGNYETEYARQLNRTGQGDIAIERNYDQSARTTSLGIDRQQMNLDEDIRLHPENADIDGQMKAQLEELRQIALSNLLDTLKTDVRHFDFSQQKAVQESRISIGSQMSTNLSALGFDTQAQTINKQTAIAQQNLDYQGQLQGLEDLRGTTGYTNDVVNELIANLGTLNELKLDNINDQFSNLGKILPIAQNGVKGFFNDLFTSTDNFGTAIGNAFRSMLQNVLSSLSQLASQAITNELFGAILGKKGGGTDPAMGSGGIIQSIFGAIAGGGGGGGAGLGGIASDALSFFGFSEGVDVVPAAGHMFDHLRSNDDPIGQALRKEGNGSILATLLPGERVLTVEKNKKYEAMGGDAVLGFKDGGVAKAIGSRIATPTLPGMQQTVNVNVPVNVEGGGGASGVDEAGLQRAVRSAVTEELIHQKRYGNALGRKG